MKKYLSIVLLLISFFVLYAGIFKLSVLITQIDQKIKLPTNINGNICKINISSITHNALKRRFVITRATDEIGVTILDDQNQIKTNEIVLISISY